MHMAVRNKGNIFLLLAALVWGMGLVSQQAGMEHLGPLGFTAVRCTLGGLSMFPVVWIADRRKKEAPQAHEAAAKKKATVKGALVCAAALITLILCQQYGLMFTTVGKAGFITALYIVITPVGSMVFLKKKISINTWAAVAIALAGMYLLCLTGGISSVNTGDLIMLLAAAASSAHMLAVDHFVEKADPVRLSCFQFMITGLACFIPALIFEGDTFNFENIRLSAVPVIYAGMASCAVGYTFQIIGQRYTDPGIAALLLSLETVFALIAGWLILGEVMEPYEYAGCALMFAAIITAQLPQRRSRKDMPPDI